MLITVAVSESGVFATWNRRAIEIGGIILALTVALLATVRGMQRELAQRRAAEAAARETSARYRELAESSRDTILRLKLDGTLRYVSPSIEELLGYRPQELSGATGASLVDPRDVGVVERAMGRLRSGAEHASATYRCRRKDGTVVWIESLFRLIRDPQTNAPSEAIANCRDVTRRMNTEADLTRSAATDGLTGLANRRRFDEVLSLEWRRAHRENTFLAVMLLDADCFKAFNDNYGHLEGDAALQMIASAIAATIRRPGDLGARYGGEEFAVLMPNTDEAGALVIAERVRAMVLEAAMPHRGGPAGVVSVSIGVAAALVFEGDTPDLLLRTADQALYRAKHRGRNLVVAGDTRHDHTEVLREPDIAEMS
jgi:diguanylate cyclase (GGDEF)-like protein/PAS domain S-box-containing protein